MKLDPLKLYIVRGLPGSGKSTYVRDCSDAWDDDHWEADMFFENDAGDYRFDGKLIEEAHKWCYTNVLRSLRNGYNVWVSNTFTRVWEMTPYIDMVNLVEEDVEIVIIEIKTQFESIRGVPEKTLKSMKDRWEEIPAEWQDKFVVNRITE